MGYLSSRAFWAGVLAAIACVLLISGGTAFFWPDVPAVGLLARSLESLAPQLIIAGLIVAFAIACLGARGLAAVLAIAGLIGGGTLVTRHLGYSAAVQGGEADLDLIWFNVLHNNPEPPGNVADALLESDADILLLSEPEQLEAEFDRLLQSYPYAAGCRGECPLTALSRYPLEVISFKRMRHWRPGRLLVLRVVPQGSAAVTIVATHQVKPWYYGASEEDRWYLADTLNDLEGPVVLAGDFNAAPWSRRLDELYDVFGFTPSRMPVGTWPAAAGPLGVPIDHVMTRGGADLVSYEPWGADLGSNHRGLRAGISLPHAE